MVSALFWPLFRLACFTALVRGIFLWLEQSHQIYVDRWVAIMIGTAESMAIQAPAWVGWVLAGTAGLLGSAIWEFVKRRRSRSLQQVNESPDKHAPPPEAKSLPRFDVKYRFEDGFAEICIRNLSAEKSLDEVVVAIPNYSESLDFYERKDLFVQLMPRDKGESIHPKAQKYYRFARVASAAKEPAVELWAGDSAVKTLQGRECAIKFRISARDVPEQIYYVAATVNSSGGLSLGRYKRKKKKAANDPGDKTDFLHAIAALRTVETELRGQQVSAQQLDVWEKTVGTVRNEISKTIKENISPAEAEAFTTVGNLKYSWGGGGTIRLTYHGFAHRFAAHCERRASRD